MTFNPAAFSDERTRLGILRGILAEQPAFEPRTAAVRIQCGVAEQDDAAIIDVSDGWNLVETSDYVRGTGFNLFRLGQMSYRGVGRYLVAANLSDLAAMGALPHWITTIIRYNPGMTDGQFADVVRGIAESCTKYRVALVGGDIGGADADVFAATAHGLIRKDKPALRRSGARPGDLLCITGSSLGRALAARAYWEVLYDEGFRLMPGTESDLRAAWDNPIPHITDGIQLHEYCLATACQDTSDGLTATVQEMAEASGVGFTLRSWKIPLHPTILRIAEYCNVDPYRLGLSASPDFQLLFTVPPEKVDSCRNTLHYDMSRLYVIGVATAEKDLLLQTADNRFVELPGIPWQQQSGDLVRQLLGRS